METIYVTFRDFGGFTTSCFIPMFINFVDDAPILEFTDEWFQEVVIGRPTSILWNENGNLCFYI